MGGNRVEVEPTRTSLDLAPASSASPSPSSGVFFHSAARVIPGNWPPQSQGDDGNKGARGTWTRSAPPHLLHLAGFFLIAILHRLVCVVGVTQRFKEREEPMTMLLGITLLM